VKVKICGLSEVEQAKASVEAGADFLGLVFAASRRRITIEKACEISREIHGNKHAEAVGVFAQSPLVEIKRIVALCKLDRVQLSGDEKLEDYTGLDKPIIKTIHISNGMTASKILMEMERGYQIISEKRLTFLLDTGSQSAYGGTGQVFDWRLAEEIAARYPVIIAGGLTPENVRQMIKQVKPWGVDVSSGVETEGKKDIAKIRNFVKIVNSFGG
jgi:phosphoribosylanthranilate isomerase